MASKSPPDLPVPARWQPCDHVCQRTLRWPVRQDAGPARLADGFVTAAPCPLPEVPLPAHSVLALCGEAGIRRLVHRHMTRLRLTPLLADVQDCFDCVADRVADFVIESCGGPLYYSQHHSRLQAGGGLPVLLDEVGREIWLVQLWHSFDDVGWPRGLRADLWRWAEPLSLHLLAPRARRAPLRRYPFEEVRAWFRTPA